MNLLKMKLDLPCGVVLKNRICKAAMTERVADSFNHANFKHHTLYSKWLNGNCGLLVTGNVMVDRNNVEAPGNVIIEKESYKRHLPALKKWAEVSKQNGNQIWMQISHAGRQTPKSLNSSPMAPSASQLKIPGRRYGISVEMTENDIIDTIDRFVFTAKVAKEAGFTGIQLHSAHGYLLSQFLSPNINRRTDAWGGSIKNRARLLLSIIDRCRKSLGKSFPISVKLNSADFKKGGFSPQESIKVASLLDKSGIDLLEISGGTYEQAKFLGYDKLSASKRTNILMNKSRIAKESYFLDYAEKISNSIDIPIMVTGGFRSRKGMEAALASNACDVIGLARPMCSNPSSVARLIDKKIDVLPIFEDRLSIGKSFFSINSPIKIIKALNAFCVISWFYIQIRRMGDGHEPDLKLKPLVALLKNERLEYLSTKNYKRHKSRII